MSTLNQQCVIKKVLKSIENMEKINLSKILVDCGYSEKTAQGNSKKIKNSKGFQEELAKIDDNKIINKWYEWALDGKAKRVSMDAGKEIMKLKDRYPAGKYKVGALEERDKVVDDDKTNTPDIPIPSQSQSPLQTA